MKKGLAMKTKHSCAAVDDNERLKEVIKSALKFSNGVCPWCVRNMKESFSIHKSSCVAFHEDGDVR